jgi:hypothetical protein
MGKPAIRYLRWMISHPRETLEGHVTRMDRLRERVPRPLRKLLPTPPPRRSRANFTQVVNAFCWIGPNARAGTSGLVRLWESNAIQTMPGSTVFHSCSLNLETLHPKCSRHCVNASTHRTGCIALSVPLLCGD